MQRRSLCPVCGYELDFTPWYVGTQREMPCPCCGIHFGQDDVIETQRESIYAAWRKRWLSDGGRWWSKNPQPPDFDPDAQLRRLMAS
jgi:hypothetical protein